MDESKSRSESALSVRQRIDAFARLLWPTANADDVLEDALKSKFFKAARAEDAKEWLCSGNRGEYGRPEPYYCAIAQTIEDLQVALASQIEITNMERASKESAETVLVALQASRSERLFTEAEIEVMLDNAACAAQERGLLRNADGGETVLREAVRLNVVKPLCERKGSDG